MSEFYMIFARKINRIPEFYMILPEKYFCRFFFLGGGQVPPAPVSYACAPCKNYAPSLVTDEPAT